MKKIKDYTKENWNYLIILDASRWDVFKEIFDEQDLPGRVEKYNTRVVKTSFWYRKYWSYNDNDITLISTNPVPFEKGSWNAHEKFKDYIWADVEGYKKGKYNTIDTSMKLDFKDLDSEFHPKIALDIFEKVKQPGERYLIHLIPPHLPFIGNKGKKLFKKLDQELRMSPDSYELMQKYGREGNWEELRECYKDSLKTAIDYVLSRKGLFDDGKLVISSDHAELLGEPNFDNEGVYRHNYRYGIEPDSPGEKVLMTSMWWEL